jgi:hypothetical protein
MDTKTVTDTSVPPMSPALSAPADKPCEQQCHDKKEKDMEHAIQRLRASKLRSATSNYKDGAAAVAAWAKDRAEADELQRGSGYVGESERDGIPWWDEGYHGWSAPYGAADNFAFAVLGLKDGDREASDEFWQAVLGDDTDKAHNSDFLHGFGVGIFAFWYEVADKL